MPRQNQPETKICTQCFHAFHSCMQLYSYIILPPLSATLLIPSTVQFVYSTKVHTYEFSRRRGQSVCARRCVQCERVAEPSILTPAHPQLLYAIRRTAAAKLAWALIGIFSIHSFMHSTQHDNIDVNGAQIIIYIYIHIYKHPYSIHTLRWLHASQLDNNSVQQW